MFANELKKYRFKLVLKFIIGKLLSSVFLAACYFFYNHHVKLTEEGIWQNRYLTNLKYIERVGLNQNIVSQVNLLLERIALENNLKNFKLIDSLAINSLSIDLETVNNGDVTGIVNEILGVFAKKITIKSVESTKLDLHNQTTYHVQLILNLL
jgi:hypothetical protein